MQEFGPTIDNEILQNKKRLEHCDLICMVYDSADPNSFSYVANLQTRYELDHIPIVFIATKTDLDLVAQKYVTQPDTFCRNLGLQVPISVSFKMGEKANLFQKLIEICINPYLKLTRSGATPGFSLGKNVKIYKVVGWTALCVGLVAIGVGVWYRLGRNS